MIEFWSQEYFSKCSKSYWVFYESLNEVDRDMKAIMVSFFDDLIPCKEVVKADSVEG